MKSPRTYANNTIDVFLGTLFISIAIGILRISPRTFIDDMVDNYMIDSMDYFTRFLSMNFDNGLPKVKFIDFLCLILIILSFMYSFYAYLIPYLDVGSIVSDKTYQKKLRIVDELKYRHPSGWYYVCDGKDVEKLQLKRFQVILQL
jgi:hypothetical protein